METKQLSTAPYKGTSDTYPKDLLAKNYIFDTWKRIARSFGYEEYDTPMIEEANLYRVKSGDELANTQLYNFTDKGGREIALRPEMTPSLARMIAARKNELILPIRWFNIGKYYRYEKPQRGRTREFFQLNFDIFGVSSIQAELEVIQFVMTVMEEFKAPNDTFMLRINNRYLLEYLFEDMLKLDKTKRPEVAKAIDNYLKIEKSEFKEYLKEIDLDDSQIDILLSYLNWTLEDLESIKDNSRGASELLDLFEKAENLGISNISFSPYIVRGLQYYTGTVIEMYDIGSKENQRALFGGGRYDDLLEIFNLEKLPAFGLGWGDVTMLNYLKTYNLLPEFKSEIDIFITLLDKALYKEVNKAAEFLRKKGLKVLTQLEQTKLSNQLKYANRKEIPWVMIIGEDEIKKNTVVLKNMISSEQFDLPLEEVFSKIS